MAVARDFDWITSHYAELQRKYPNRYVAVKNGRVVASGRGFGKVYDAAVRKVKKDFVTGYILSEDPFVLDTHLQHLTDRVWENLRVELTELNGILNGRAAEVSV